MVPISRRNLLKNKLRLAISAAGVALAIILMLILNGFLAGMYHQITAYIDNTPADLYLAQKGVANMQGAGSIIPRSTVEKIEAVEGVKAAMPVFAQYAILDRHGKKVTTLLVGYEPDRGGGPWRLGAGRQVQSADEVVLDRVFARRYEMGIGDQIDILGRQFRVVGLSEDTASWMVSTLFLRHDAVTSLLRSPGTTSFVLVATDDPAATAERIAAALPDVGVLPRETIAANDIAYLGQAFSIPLRMMVLISVGIGALLVGLTIYSATVERVREYGVLKAVGMRNGRLYGIVAQQALGATALGFAVGLVLVRVVVGGIEYQWPQFLLIVDGSSIAQAAIGAVIMATVAAFLPARYVGSIDPAQVFRR